MARPSKLMSRGTREDAELQAGQENLWKNDARKKGGTGSRLGDPSNPEQTRDSVETRSPVAVPRRPFPTLRPASRTWSTQLWNSVDEHRHLQLTCTDVWQFNIARVLDMRAFLLITASRWAGSVQLRHPSEAARYRPPRRTAKFCSEPSRVQLPESAIRRRAAGIRFLPGRYRYFFKGPHTTPSHWPSPERRLRSRSQLQPCPSIHPRPLENVENGYVMRIILVALQVLRQRLFSTFACCHPGVSGMPCVEL